MDRRAIWVVLGILGAVGLVLARDPLRRATVGRVGRRRLVAAVGSPGML